MERLPWGISSESVTFLTAEEEHYIDPGHKENDSFLPNELLEQLHRIKYSPVFPPHPPAPAVWVQATPLTS